ncbi:hypothetical protein QCA50_009766 [Cerrena zonata]|uniref:Cytochrome P450 n=1 Tax=Cerrena zonata TaxID=2478898 RepID=A0AAW0G212_9APHY
METILIVSGMSFLLLLFRWFKYRSSLSLPLPPGPKGLPIVGNVLDIPSSMPWKAFRDLSTIYGDVLLLRIPTLPIVVLGSAQAAFDLLEKRSDIYSSRPHKMMYDLCVAIERLSPDAILTPSVDYAHGLGTSVQWSIRPDGVSSEEDFTNTFINMR